MQRKANACFGTQRLCGDVAGLVRLAMHAGPCLLEFLRLVQCEVLEDGAGKG